MKAITVMVTGVGGGGQGEQILKALKMASTPYEIVGGDMDPRSMGLGFVDHPYILPPASNPSYIDCVMAACQRHRVKALFLGSDPELIAISFNKRRLEDSGLLLPINPPEVLEVCHDKNKTMSFLAEHDFSHPRYIEVGGVADLEKIDFLPAVLKPSLGGGGSANIFLAQTHEELTFFGLHLLDLVKTFICQEYVGVPQEEYTVGVLLDLDGNLINSIAIRRNLSSGLSCRLKVPNRTERSELGHTLVISSGVSQGDVGMFREVTEPCERLALELECTGAVNIQCRLVDNRPVVFEINPRFSGTTSLRALAGYNEPDVLIRRHILGEQISKWFPYGNGVICRGLKETFLGDISFPLAKDLL